MINPCHPKKYKVITLSLIVAFMSAIFTSASMAELSDIKKRGILRHLGVRYAYFVTGSGDGLDVELMKIFAIHLGVDYEFVPTDWDHVISDLTGKLILNSDETHTVIGTTRVKGDIIATGLTQLKWRKKLIDYSIPTFPSQIWLIAQADLPIHPILPFGNIQKDIDAVKEKMKGIRILGKKNTCLDPSLYHLKKTGARPILYKGNLNELIPAIINGIGEATLLNVPDALIALEKWPGKIKVIGPVSKPQIMGVGFSKSAPKLKSAFNAFFLQCLKNGAYEKLLKKYYPAVASYYPGFFDQIKTQHLSLAP